MPSSAPPRHALAGFVLAVGLSAAAHAQPTHVADYELPGAPPGAAFGLSAAFAGDPDGDLLADFVVGAPGAANGTGSVAFVPGDLSEPTIVLSPNAQVGGFYGWSVAHVGDIAGSEAGSDYVVGAPGESAGAPGSGRAYVYSPGQNPQPYASPNPELNGLFGFATAGVGDLLGAPSDDIGVGAPGETVAGESGAGRVYLFGLGGSAALQSVVAQQDGNFGAALAPIGDLDGDGSPNLLVGAPGEDSATDDAGLVHIYANTEFELATSSLNPMKGGRYGAAIAGLGDLDDDGDMEWAVGAPGESNGDGRVYVYSSYAKLVAILAAPESALLASGGAVNFGIALDTADVDEDGITDLLVGASGVSDDFVRQGRVFAYSGVDMSLIGALLPDVPATSAEFGTSIAVGRMPRGPLRIVAGAPGEGEGAGRAHLFSLGSVTSGEPLAGDGEGSALRPPRPNPFGSRATVAFELGTAGPARLALYDALGREVAVVFEGVAAAGAHQATLDSTGLPSGVYVLRLSTPDGVDVTRRVTVVR